MLRASNAYRTARLVVFHRITGDIHDQALQMQRTRHDHGMGYAASVAADGHTELRGLMFHDLANLLDDFNKVGRLQVQLHLAAFEFAHVKNFVDQFGKYPRRRPDLLATLALFGKIPIIGIGDFHHAADAVYGRADVVAHALQKLGFRPVRALRLMCRHGKTIGVLALLQHKLMQVLVLGFAPREGEHGNHKAIQRDGNQHEPRHFAQARRSRHERKNIVITSLVEGSDIGFRP